MNLHENKDTFRNAIRAASDHLGVRDEYIEKDYWVTFLLKRLSLSPNSKNVVFKGGTSLSKVHKLIARFSEDKTKFEDPEEWLKAHYTDAPIFKSFDEIWDKVKGNYETEFRLLVFGEFPGERQIAEQFKSLLKSLE